MCHTNHWGWTNPHMAVWYAAHKHTYTFLYACDSKTYTILMWVRFVFLNLVHDCQLQAEVRFSWEAGVQYIEETKLNPNQIIKPLTLPEWQFHLALLFLQSLICYPNCDIVTLLQTPVHAQQNQRNNKGFWSPKPQSVLSTMLRQTLPQDGN